VLLEISFPNTTIINIANKRIPLENTEKKMDSSIVPIAPIFKSLLEKTFCNVLFK
jgi:hypothetical protein